MASGASKLNEEKVELIKQLLNTGDFTHQQIGDLFGVSREHITHINTGYRWGNIHHKQIIGIRVLYDDGTTMDI